MSAEARQLFEQNLSLGNASGSRTVLRTVYRIRFQTKVDKPEKRMEGMYRPTASAILTEEKFFTDRKKADNFYASLLSGEYDYGSEYVSRVYFHSRSLYTNGALVQQSVRKTHMRTRKAVVPRFRNKDSVSGGFAFDSSSEETWRPSSESRRPLPGSVIHVGSRVFKL